MKKIFLKSEKNIFYFKRKKWKKKLWKKVKKEWKKKLSKLLYILKKKVYILKKSCVWKHDGDGLQFVLTKKISQIICFQVKKSLKKLFDKLFIIKKEV